MWRAGILLLIVFLIFSKAVKQGYLEQFDFDTTVRSQDHVDPKLDARFSAISLFGSFEITTLFLLGILVVRRQWQGWWTVTRYGFGLFVELVGKNLVPHPGPPFMFYRNALNFSFPSNYVHSNFSYPSGHTYRTAFLAVLLGVWVLRSKKLSLLKKAFVFAGLAGWLFLMGLSRVTLGEHWATDVIGGSLLGAGLALL